MVPENNQLPYYPNQWFRGVRPFLKSDVSPNLGVRPFLLHELASPLPCWGPRDILIHENKKLLWYVP